MAKKEFMYRGKTLDEMKNLSREELLEILPASARRKMKRGFTDQEKILLSNIKEKKSNIKTHCRDMVILPEMVGIMVKVHKGNDYVLVSINEEMIGHCLGEFAMTRKRVTHSSPGVGATKSSSNISVK
ncbi:30S ribosomal protein S19 [Candidatus Woesearchaeota archaeon]|nr:30S ribosomal protein S19 [Candidatus Woesearchaeota archaeon]